VHKQSASRIPGTKIRAIHQADGVSFCTGASSQPTRIPTQHPKLNPAIINALKFRGQKLQRCPHVIQLASAFAADTLAQPWCFRN
jgi:hypothetical protein